MYSHVTLLGRFTKQPELKVTPSGISLANFDLAVDRRPNGNGQKETDFISCTAFGKGAENICKYMDKGRLILVSGRLQTRSWEGQDGVKRKVTEVLVNESTFMPGGQKQKQDTDTGPDDYE